MTARAGRGHPHTPRSGESPAPDAVRLPRVNRRQAQGLGDGPVGCVLAISGLLVRPHAQDRDVARQLRERLLTGRQASLGAALVNRADHLTLVGEVWRPVGVRVLRALLFPVGERAGVGLEGVVPGVRRRWSG